MGGDKTNDLSLPTDCEGKECGLSKSGALCGACVSGWTCTDFKCQDSPAKCSHDAYLDACQAWNFAVVSGTACVNALIACYSSAPLSGGLGLAPCLKTAVALGCSWTTPYLLEIRRSLERCTNYYGDCHNNGGRQLRPRICDPRGMQNVQANPGLLMVPYCQSCCLGAYPYHRKQPAPPPPLPIKERVPQYTSVFGPIVPGPNDEKRQQCVERCMELGLETSTPDP